VRPSTFRSAALLTAACAVAVALYATADQRVIHRPTRWGVRRGCVALVSRDECRRVVAQPTMVRVWSWGRFAPATAWTRWDDWG